MKKLLFLVVMVVLVWLLLSVGVVFAEDNLQKAGEEALREREEVLLQKKAELDNFVQEAAEDRLVTRDEMVAFRDLVDDFNATKKIFDRELELYQRVTSVALDESYQKAVDSYFLMDVIIMKDDIDEGARRFFVAQTGHDIKVERGVVWNETSIILVVISSIGLSMIIGGISKKKPGPLTAGIIFFLVFGIMTLVLLLT